MKASRTALQSSRALCISPFKTTPLQQIPKPLLTTSPVRHLSPLQPRLRRPQSPSLPRFFSCSAISRITLTPEASQPKPSVNESKNKDLEASDISESEYHERADQYLNNLLQKLEELIESDQHKGLEVEFSVRPLLSHSTHPS